MTDLHNHILPGMDDGPKDPEAARALLKLQLDQGVDQVALTSHYHCEGEDPDHFLQRREQAFRLLEAVCPEGLTLKRGCEVYYSPALTELDLQKLCLEGTNVLLLELPVLQKPAFLSEVLSAISSRGILPLIAHAERYQYVRKNPGILADWMDLGARIQVNARSVLDDGMTRRLIKWGLCQVVASDCHSAAPRPPNLEQAHRLIARSLGREKARELEENARMLFEGTQIPCGQVRMPRKVMGLWL